MSALTKNGVLVFAAVACGLALSARPWLLTREENAHAAMQNRAARADEARMIADQTAASRLSTELGKEELLRAQGFRKAGEQPVP